jgi:hypothetical protein
MGYFPNGTAGELYEGRWCRRCVHEIGCRVWWLHMEHNYEECNKKESMLHVLIPRVGTHNCRCQMFHLKERGE